MLSLDFYGDGTFYSDEGYVGTWTQSGCDVDYVFEGGTHYWGVESLDGSSMSGDMDAPNGNTGCWTATPNTTASQRMEVNGSASGLDASGSKMK